MNEKIAIQELAEQFAESKGIKPIEAENFIKEFFKVIEKALQTDRYVKIKGFGTFKLIEVDSRESININTGERIEIQGHNKITFTPDTTLKELVNKPFSHFESVVLNDGAFIDDLPADEDDSEETAPIIEEPILEEPIIEEPSRDVACSVHEDIQEEEPIIEEETPVLEEAPSRDAIHCVRENEKEETPEPIIEEPSRDVACSVREEENESPLPPTGFIAESITNIENELETNKRPESMIGNLKNTIANDFKQDTQGMKYFFGIVIFIILLCVAAILFLYHPTLLTDLMPQPQEQEEVTTEEITPEAAPQEIIPADTIALPADTVVVATDTIAAQPEPVVEEKPQPAPQPAPQPVTTYKASGVYTITGTQAEHTIKRGETLRIVSEKYFGTRELSTYIVEHNKDIISNPNNVAVGTKIKIPKLEKK